VSLLIVRPKKIFFRPKIISFFIQTCHFRFLWTHIYSCSVLYGFYWIINQFILTFVTLENSSVFVVIASSWDRLTWLIYTWPCYSPKQQVQSSKPTYVGYFLIILISTHFPNTYNFTLMLIQTKADIGRYNIIDILSYHYIIISLFRG
jgi:hypothetical protein